MRTALSQGERNFKRSGKVNKRRLLHKSLQLNLMLFDCKVCGGLNNDHERKRCGLTYEDNKNVCPHTKSKRMTQMMILNILRLRMTYTINYRKERKSGKLD